MKTAATMALVGCMVLAATFEVDAANCSKAMAIAAETKAGELKSWSEVYVWFKRYRNCDDGAIAEGFTESITILLARQWSVLPQLAARADKDTQFRAFVLKHIDESADADNLRLIEENAKRKCPPKYTRLCGAFIKRLRE